MLVREQQYVALLLVERKEPVAFGFFVFYMLSPVFFSKSVYQKRFPTLHRVTYSRILSSFLIACGRGDTEYFSYLSVAEALDGLQFRRLYILLGLFHSRAQI